MSKISLVFKMAITALIYGVIFTNCGGSGSRTNKYMAIGNDTIAEPNTVLVKLEPLKDETLRLKGKDPFGNVIELKGEQIIVDDLIFTPSEIKMVIKDNYLIIRTRNRDGAFSILSLPDLRLIKTFGRIGRGPDELLAPKLFRNTDPDILASIFDINGKIYDVLPSGAMTSNNMNLPSRRELTSRGEIILSEYSVENPELMTDTLLYFAGNSPTGKSIFTIGGTDNIKVSEIQNLALNPRRKGWANYIGDFTINMEQTRMVYAYKYFKIVKFFDLEHNTVRTVNFERTEFDESTLYQADGLDSNVTHYWGICAGDKYVYMLYSGRTPGQVWSDNRKENYYIFVEKYDWNGQPIVKYKLDQWGFFTVDEKNNTLYLVSTNDDDPFFKYQL